MECLSGSGLSAFACIVVCHISLLSMEPSERPGNRSASKIQLLLRKRLLEKNLLTQSLLRWRPLSFPKPAGVVAVSLLVCWIIPPRPALSSISSSPTRATNRPSRLDLQRGIGPFQPMRHLDQECGLNASNSPDHLPTFLRSGAETHQRLNDQPATSDQLDLNAAI